MAEAHTTGGLAEKLTPHVQQFLGDHKDEFASRAGGPIQRMAVKFGIPIAQRETPVLLEDGLDALGNELNSWSIHDVLAWLTSVAQKTGKQSRPHAEFQAQRGYQ